MELVLKRTVGRLFRPFCQKQTNRSPEQVLNKSVIIDCFFSSNVSTDVHVVFGNDLERFCTTKLAVLGPLSGPCRTPRQFLTPSQANGGGGKRKN